MSRLHLSIISFIMLITASMATWGVVNQNIGIPDTRFNELSAEACRQCHEPSSGIQPLMMIPYQDRYLSNRHHQHIDTSIAGGSESPPFMDADGDLVDDTVYSCANCHDTCVPNMECIDGGMMPLDCLDCHITEVNMRTAYQRTVHHDTQKAKEGKCAACHGSVVNNLDAGQAPPTWSPTMTTPWPSNKPNSDSNITSLAGTHPGNCDYCHSVDTSISDPIPSSFGPIVVYSNAETHHITGASRYAGSANGYSCWWCHSENYASIQAGEYIRTCERCHDMSSLHSIQYDASGDGVVPGSEPSYQGHIGNGEDCWGCHGYDESQSETPLALGDAGTQATTPQLENISALTWKEGMELEMTLSGSGFINQGGLDNAVTYRPTVQLTDSEGNATVLSPIAESTASVQVAIPGELPAGNYLVQIKKDDKLSNPIGTSIVPAINVRPGGAICLSEYRVVLLRGAGFNVYTSNMPSWVTGITGDGADASRIFLWRDGMIAARFNAGCPSEVTVNNVFDSVTLMPAIR